jgi:hypothetical protein
MRRLIATFVILVATVTIGILVSPAKYGGAAMLVVHAEETQGACSVTSLTGRYAVTAEGTIIGQLPGLPAPPFPFGEVGIDTFDGAGTWSGQVTVNLGGAVAPVSVNGTYTINSDCSGTRTYKTSLGLIAHDAFVATGGGRELVLTQTDSFGVVQRKLKKLED